MGNSIRLNTRRFILAYGEATQQTTSDGSSVALFQQQIHLSPRTRIIVRRITTYKTLFQDSGHRRNFLIPPEQGESKSKALGCLNKLFQRFSNKSTFQQRYVDFLEEYLKMDHMTEVDASSDQTPFAHYLPHHGVLRENNRTTKLRVVFNGSSRTSNGLSLNDILHGGAKLQNDMCDLLLWTRTHKVLFSADIVKMFRQIAVHPDDWDLQRILLYGPDNQLIAYRLTTVTYGLNCAPFLALRTLQQLVIPDTTTFTKRAIASDIAKLYDPLGLISPILIRAKTIFQDLWLLKTGWDEPLSTELQDRWSAFRQQLQQLEPLSIPRWLGIVCSDTSRIEMHGFSDASQLAMAAAVYIRTPSKDNAFSVQLVCSKTRVAPLKRLTIPRLELTAALLLARLIARATKALELPEAPVFCWSDSSVTLAWITAHPSRWKDFVRNRVSAIQEILPNGSWRFVPGKENPADLASRGLRPDQLLHHDL
ncbi:integrase core domain protein [Lasius niger]|uniref:Integrase core domain protein n=1 Tax=Lasius niger TaxID=67767 RepID=A0A0J7MWP0_LASNI|nr:integrase core domain protein [Lasius niger]